MDQLVYSIADLNLDIISLAHDTNIGFTKLTQQIKWLLGFLA